MITNCNAKDYGVAQNRERVFIVSILGEYNYTFPKPIPLTKRLKDYLEDEVDEKYYLSDKMITYLTDVKDRNGRKTGQKEMAALIKGRLLLINSITIDGERVFTREDEPADSNDASQAAPQGKAGDASPESAPTAGADAPESQPQSEEANPQRNDRLTRAAPRAAGPIARQSTSRVNERSTAYQGGYAAGRTVRQGYDAAARAAA